MALRSGYLGVYLNVTIKVMGGNKQLIFKRFYLFYVRICRNVCAPCVCSTYKEQKRAPDLVELEIEAESSTRGTRLAECCDISLAPDNIFLNILIFYSFTSFPTTKLISLPYLKLTFFFLLLHTLFVLLNNLKGIGYSFNILSYVWLFTGLQLTNQSHTLKENLH